MSLDDQIQQALADKFKRLEQRDGYEAKLGNPSDVLRVDTMPADYVYARVQTPTGLSVWEVLCTKVTPQVGLEVIVKKGRYDIWYVAEQNPRSASDFWNGGGGGGNVGKHGGAHHLRGADPTIIDPLQITHFRTAPTKPASLSVTLSDYLYFHDGAWVAFSSSDIDLTSKVPSGGETKQRLIITGIDKDTNLVTTVDGTVKTIPGATSSTLSFGVTDIQALLERSASDTFEPSAAIRLYGGQTTVRQRDIFFDCKVSAGSAAATVLGDWDVDAQPADPSALDDEFNDATFNTSLWTEFDPDAAQTVSESGTTIALSQPTDTTALLTGIYQEIPVGNFTIVCKVQIDVGTLTGTGKACQAGLVLWDDATGSDNKALLLGPGVKSSGTTPLNGIGGITHWAGHNDLQALPTFYGGMEADTDYYVRVRRTATTYTYDYSNNGIDWGASFNVASTFTPSHFGVGMFNKNTGVTITATFDFFRYRDVADARTDPVYGDFGAFQDRKVRVSDNDTTSGYLGTKLLEGTGISLTENDDGGNETLTISATNNGDMTKTVYDTNDDGSVDEADYAATAGDADTVDGQHAADFAPVAHTHTDYVPNSLYDAQSILAATADNAPAAVTVADNTLIGRAGGNIDDLAVADQTFVGRGGGNIDDIAVAEQRFVGRITSGNLGALTGAQAWGVLNGQDLPPAADVTYDLGSAAARYAEGWIQKPMVDAVAFRVKNTSGADATVNMSGYLDVNGEFKTTTTAGLIAAWVVVLVEGANNADIYVTRQGVVTLELNGNCAVGDWLKLSTTAGQAAVAGTSPVAEAFAIARTANVSGAGGTCQAMLYCNSLYVPIASANNLFSRVSVSDSDWSGTQNGAVSGANLVYTPTGGDEAILSLSATEIGLVVLHNTTKGQSAIISACNTGTNTITVTAAADISTWQNGDVLTVRSQTNTDTVTGAYFLDLDLTSEIPDLAYALIMYTNNLTDTGGTGAAVLVHPYETGSGSKRKTTAGVVVASVGHRGAELAINIIGGRICLLVNAATGSTNSVTVTMRVGGVFIKVP